MLVLSRLAEEGRQNHLLLTVFSILQYNRAMRKVMQRQYKEDSDRYPVLSMDVEEIMNQSLSEIDLQDLRDLLKEVTERDMKWKKRVLSSECLYATTFALLRHTLTTRERFSFEVFVYCVLQQPSPHCIHLSLVGVTASLWNDHFEELTQLFRLSIAETALGRLFQILLACLPQKVSAGLFPFLVPPARGASLFQSNIILLQQVINHTKCPLQTIASIEFYQLQCGQSLSYFAPVVMNWTESLHTRFSQLHENRTDETILLLRMLIDPLMQINILHTERFYTNVMQIVNDAAQSIRSVSEAAQLLLEANSFITRQMNNDAENRTRLHSMVLYDIFI